jgi:hypothetical protein
MIDTDFTSLAEAQNKKVGVSLSAGTQAWKSFWTVGITPYHLFRYISHLESVPLFLYLPLFIYF